MHELQDTAIHTANTLPETNESQFEQGAKAIHENPQLHDAGSAALQQENGCIILP